MMCVAVGMAVVGQARLVIKRLARAMVKARVMGGQILCRSEEHTSELQ